MKGSRFMVRPGGPWWLLAVAWLALNPVLAQAASKEGKYAYDGVGGLTCEQFVGLAQGGEDSPGSQYFYLGWVAGYLSGHNRLAEDTVDLTPWQDINLIGRFRASYCTKVPERRFVDAMVKELVPFRIRNSLEMVEVTDGETTLRHYKVVIRRAQEVLSELEFYEGDIDGEFGDSTRQAFEAYQTEKGIDPSGLPDQTTLFNLFR